MTLPASGILTANMIAQELYGRNAQAGDTNYSYWQESYLPRPYAPFPHTRWYGYKHLPHVFMQTPSVWNIQPTTVAITWSFALTREARYPLTVYMEYESPSGVMTPINFTIQTGNPVYGYAFEYARQATPRQVQAKVLSNANYVIGIQDIVYATIPALGT